MASATLNLRLPSQPLPFNRYSFHIPHRVGGWDGLSNLLGLYIPRQYTLMRSPISVLTGLDVEWLRRCDQRRWTTGPGVGRQTRRCVLRFRVKSGLQAKCAGSKTSPERRRRRRRRIPTRRKWAAGRTVAVRCGPSPRAVRRAAVSHRPDRHAPWTRGGGSSLDRRTHYQFRRR